MSSPGDGRWPGMTKGTSMADDGSGGARPLTGQAIRHLREKRGLSARALSARAGLSAAYVCRLEAGQVAEPSLAVFARLAVALEMSALEVYTVVLSEASALLSQLPTRIRADAS